MNHLGWDGRLRAFSLPSPTVVSDGCTLRLRVRRPVALKYCNIYIYTLPSEIECAILHRGVQIWLWA